VVALLLALSRCQTPSSPIESRRDELREIDPLRAEREALQAWNDGRTEALVVRRCAADWRAAATRRRVESGWRDHVDEAIAEGQSFEFEGAESA
jgi:hypothetical protein